MERGIPGCCQAIVGWSLDRTLTVGMIVHADKGAFRGLKQDNCEFEVIQDETLIPYLTRMKRNRKSIV